MIFSKDTETAQKEEDEESSREIRNDGDSPSQMVFDEVPSTNTDMRTGSLLASSSSLFPSRTRSSDANLQEVRRKRNTDMRIRRGSPPFLQWNEGNTDGAARSAAAIRKRSRMGDVGGFDNLTIGQDSGSKKKLDDYLKQLHIAIENTVKKSEKTKVINHKLLISEIMKDITREVISTLTFANSLATRIISHLDMKSEQERKINNLLEENNALRQQIIELQNVATSGSPTYLQAAIGRKMSTGHKEGKVLPIPKIPDPVRHVPSEKILIFKAKEKGEQVSKKEQEDFRREIRTAIGEEMTKEIEVIRPTRYGGHTIVFQSETGRDKALERLRENESATKTTNSCIISPQKKTAKVLCREPPEDVKEDTFITDMFSTRNVHLCKIPKESRQVKIYNSPVLGWIFEVSSIEAQAIYLQGSRIRYGYGRECKVEEFIPLQQCYKCCVFGHNAINCTSPVEFCRLCGKKGHAGKDCNKKNDKKVWSCINCKITNETKGYNLPTDHAAAQLHRCPCAINQKLIKKEQLAAAGIFITPVSEALVKKQESFMSFNNEENKKFGSDMNRKNRRGSTIRSQSRVPGKDVIQRGSSRGNRYKYDTRIPETTLQSEKGRQRSKEITKEGMQKGKIDERRVMVESQSTTTEGWKVVRKGKFVEEKEGRGRDTADCEGGTNSTSSLVMLNLGHRVLAHDSLMAWLWTQNKNWILMIQEPFFTRKGLSKLPKDYGGFWAEDENQRKKVRSLIIAPKMLQGYLVSQRSNKDCVIVRFNMIGFSVASIYCPIEEKIESNMNGLMEENNDRRKIICGMDSNSYHSRWGSNLRVNKKWSGKKRGEELNEIIDSNGFMICNIIPHLATFTRDSASKNESHIDVTICTADLFNIIDDWQVKDETFSSDHRVIMFAIKRVAKDVSKGNIAYGVPWKKPKGRMKEVMEDAICKRIKLRGRISTIMSIDETVEEHTRQVSKVLKQVFKKKNKSKKSHEVYWWNDQVAAAYKKMRLARRRMRKYGYDDLKEVFKKERSNFRYVAKESKKSAWIELMQGISDPWEKLIKIIKATMMGKMQSRTLKDLDGRYVDDLKETLNFLGR